MIFQFNLSFVVISPIQASRKLLSLLAQEIQVICLVALFSCSLFACTDLLLLLFLNTDPEMATSDNKEQLKFRFIFDLFRSLLLRWVDDALNWTIYLTSLIFVCLTARKFPFAMHTVFYLVYLLWISALKQTMSCGVKTVIILLIFSILIYVDLFWWIIQFITNSNSNMVYAW